MCYILNVVDDKKRQKENIMISDLSNNEIKMLALGSMGLAIKCDNMADIVLSQVKDEYRKGNLFVVSGESYGREMINVNMLKDNGGLGCIKFASPVIHCCAIANAAKAIDISIEDVLYVVFCYKRIVIESNDETCFKQVMLDDGMLSDGRKLEKSCTTATGAGAIEHLLQQVNHNENYFVNCLPVLPEEYRVNKTSINRAYEEVIKANNDIRKLLDYGMTGMVYNLSMRKLQKNFDTLIRELEAL